MQRPSWMGWMRESRDSMSGVEVEDVAKLRMTLWKREILNQDTNVLLKAVRPRFLLVCALLSTIVLLASHFSDSNATIARASVASWCIFFLVLVALWPICLFGTFIVETVFHLYGNLITSNVLHTSQHSRRLAYRLKRQLMCLKVYLFPFRSYCGAS